MERNDSPCWELTLSEQPARTILEYFDDWMALSAGLPSAQMAAVIRACFIQHPNLRNEFPEVIEKMKEAST